ncbi:hypothetical protein V8F33_006525 [Rhypophila sp. PSN 637]
MCQDTLGILTCGCISLDGVERCKSSIKSGKPCISQPNRRHSDGTCGRDPCPTQLTAQLKAAKEREKDRAYWEAHDQKLARVRKEVADAYASGRRRATGVVLGRGLWDKPEKERREDANVANIDKSNGGAQEALTNKATGREILNDIELGPLLRNTTDSDKEKLAQSEQAITVDERKARRNSGYPSLSHGLCLYNVEEEGDDEGHYFNHARGSYNKGPDQSPTHESINNNHDIVDKDGGGNSLGSNNRHAYESLPIPPPPPLPPKMMSTTNRASSSRIDKLDFEMLTSVNRNPNLVATTTDLMDPFTDPGLGAGQQQPSILVYEPNHEKNEGSDNDEWWFESDQKALLGSPRTNHHSTPTKSDRSKEKATKNVNTPTNKGKIVKSNTNSPKTPKQSSPRFYSSTAGSGTIADGHEHVHKVNICTPTRTQSSSVTRYHSQRAVVVGGEDLDDSMSSMKSPRSNTAEAGQGTAATFNDNLATELTAAAFGDNLATESLWRDSSIRAKVMTEGDWEYFCKLD